VAITQTEIKRRLAIIWDALDIETDEAKRAKLKADETAIDELVERRGGFASRMGAKYLEVYHKTGSVNQAAPYYQLFRNYYDIDEDAAFIMEMLRRERLGRRKPKCDKPTEK